MTALALGDAHAEETGDREALLSAYEAVDGTGGRGDELAFQVGDHLQLLARVRARRSVVSRSSSRPTRRG